MRTTLLEDTANFLLVKSLAAGVDCDYGKSVLHLLYLLLSPDVKRLKVTLCCYYGCRDLDRYVYMTNSIGISDWMIGVLSLEVFPFRLYPFNEDHTHDIIT